jgi:hypothetical protein
MTSQPGQHINFVRFHRGLCKFHTKWLVRALRWGLNPHSPNCHPRRQKGNFTNSSRYMTLSLPFDPILFTLAWRLYLPHKLVRQLYCTHMADAKRKRTSGF